MKTAALSRQKRSTKNKNRTASFTGSSRRFLQTGPRGFPKSSFVAAALVALVGVWVFSIAHAGAVIVASEDFSQGSANFTTVAGGTWSTPVGSYELRNAASPADPNVGNANYAIHKVSVAGDFTEEVDFNVNSTASGFDDGSVIFNWVDPNNYMYASFNETTNSTTNGLFVISGGQQTLLANFTKNFPAGITYHSQVTRAGNVYTVQVGGVTVGTSTYAVSKGGHLGVGARNNSANFDNFVVSVPAATPAPSAPAGLTQVITTSTSIQVAWQPSTSSIGVTSYNLYLNNVLNGTAIGASYTVKGLKAGARYTIGVAAVDTAGKISARSSLTAATSGGTPAPTPTPAAAGKPSAANTGVPAGTVLTHHTGDITITTPGTVIDGLDVSGVIKVRAANVTIKNSFIHGGVQTGNTGLINAMASNVSGLLITDCTLIASNPSVWIDGVFGHDFTARRLEIAQVVDGFGVFNPNNSNGAANVDIGSSYVHDLTYFAPDPNHSDNHTHNDGIQIQGNSNIRVYGNTILANISKTAGTPTKDPYAPSVTGQAIALTPNVGAITGVTVASNWLDYGVNSITIITGSFGSQTSATITGNRFGRNQVLMSRAGVTARRAVLYDNSLNIVTSGNIYEDNGAPATMYPVPNAS